MKLLPSATLCTLRKMRSNQNVGVWSRETFIARPREREAHVLKTLGLPWWSVVYSLSRVWFCVTLWTIACQIPLSTGFSKQEYRSGKLFPSTGNLPDWGMESGSPALQADSSPSVPPGTSHTQHCIKLTCILSSSYFFFIFSLWFLGTVFDDFFSLI